MQDVARRAGTSTAVVSYVLNNGPRPVSPRTREKVLRAVGELGYRINGSARALRSRRSKIIGVILPDSSHPFFAEVLRLIERASFERGYVVMTGNSFSDAERELEYLDLFREHQVDGVILTVDPSDAVRVSIDPSIPTVLLDEPSPGLHASTMTVDNELAAHAATQVLIAEGHTRIGFIGGTPGLPSADAREKGWRRALTDAGLKAETLERTDFTREAGFATGARFLDAATPPSGIFVASDQQAVGLIRACNERSISVPADLSVVAFDDSDDAVYTSPTLTTVRQPMSDIVTRALTLLLNSPTEPVHEVFPHDIVFRGSTRPLKP